MFALIEFAWQMWLLPWGGDKTSLRSFPQHNLGAYRVRSRIAKSSKPVAFFDGAIGAAESLGEPFSSFGLIRRQGLSRW